MAIFVESPREAAFDDAERLRKLLIGGLIRGCVVRRMEQMIACILDLTSSRQPSSWAITRYQYCGCLGCVLSGYTGCWRLLNDGPPTAQKKSRELCFRVRIALFPNGSDKQGLNKVPAYIIATIISFLATLGTGLEYFQGSAYVSYIDSDQCRSRPLLRSSRFRCPHSSHRRSDC